ncbi:MAG: hypothetical protein JSS91_02650 [Bacteroidetes bacterium]|nr:hypothetical protein [Bacteroidota bacterium]
MKLRELVSNYRKDISIAVSLVIIENLAWIAEPTLFGKVIDAVIDKATSVEKISILLPVIFWASAFVINSGVGSLRRIVDPKIYQKIFIDLSYNVSKKSIKKNLNLSKTTIRAELTQQYITFLQFRLPEIIENTIAIAGAVAAMYLIDWRISITSLCIIFPLYFIGRIYNKKVSIHQKVYHDSYEDMVDVFSKKDPDYVRDFYTALADPQIKIAKWGAVNFAFLRIALLAIFLVVLYIAIDLDDFSAGELYTIVAYLWTFVTATEYLPELMENWTSLKDISSRLKQQDM